MTPVLAYAIIAAQRNSSESRCTRFLAVPNTKSTGELRRNILMRYSTLCSAPGFCPNLSSRLLVSSKFICLSCDRLSGVKYGRNCFSGNRLTGLTRKSCLLFWVYSGSVKNRALRNSAYMSVWRSHIFSETFMWNQILRARMGSEIELA